MQTATLSGGFRNAPVQAAHAFRAAMNAMARPGTIHEITGATPPTPLSPAAGTLLLTLCDPETPIYLAPGHDHDDIRAWITFHTGALFAAPQGALFALGQWDALGPLSRYPQGTPEYPDRSATLIVDGHVFGAPNARLTGPGIQTDAQMALPEIAPFQTNHAAFPLGLDTYFAGGNRLAALPRSTTVEAL